MHTFHHLLNARSLPCWLLLPLLLGASPRPETPRKGKDFALFIAVDRYDDAGWTKLDNPLRDCRSIAAELHDQFEFDTAIVANKTRAEILEAINKCYERRYDDDAQLLLFFAGHGQYNAQKCKGYFAPRDGKPRDASGASYIDYTALQGDIASIPCRHILLAIDACFGGAFDAAMGCNKERGDDDTERPADQRRDDRADFIRRTLAQESRLFFSAIGKEPTSDNSRFARRWLDALKNGCDQRGLLDAHDLRQRLRTGKEVFSSFGGNTNENAFVFARRLNIQTKDRDGDGVPNDRDDCPDEYGPAANKGCPERIGGPGQDDPNADPDYDGIPNGQDACPEEYGTVKANGCPDRDNDGVPDKSDKCPGLAGPDKWSGCPDSDGDAVPDHLDKCPLAKGPKPDGCPPPDRDRDGVPDLVDKCPDTAGKDYLQGCPDPAGSAQTTPTTTPKNADDRENWMALVPAGSFEMGSNESDDEKPVHKVSLDAFYLGKYEVTNEEFVAFLNDISGQITLSTNGDEVTYHSNIIFDVFCGEKKGGCSNFAENIEYNKGASVGGRFSVVSGCAKKPVVLVSWFGVVEYCNWLSLKHGIEPAYAISKNDVSLKSNTNGYRLPTEAQWEYAAKGGPKNESFKYAGSNDVDDVAWYSSNSGGASHPVGEKKPNSLGLYDMSGNVWEWCADWYDANYYASSKNARNPTGPASASDRVLRGGGWFTDASGCRAANRSYGGPTDRNHDIGFRVASPLQ